MRSYRVIRIQWFSEGLLVGKLGQTWVTRIWMDYDICMWMGYIHNNKIHTVIVDIYVIYNNAKIHW